MATIEQRIFQLERASNAAPWLTMDVIDRPTNEQQAEINSAKKTRRMLIVFVAKGNTAWIPGSNIPAPWECKDEDLYGNA